jgi:hypothetical protein
MENIQIRDLYIVEWVSIASHPTSTQKLHLQSKTQSRSASTWSLRLLPAPASTAAAAPTAPSSSAPGRRRLRLLGRRAPPAAEPPPPTGPSVCFIASNSLGRGQRYPIFTTPKEGDEEWISCMSLRLEGDFMCF